MTKKNSVCLVLNYFKPSLKFPPGLYYSTHKMGLGDWLLLRRPGSPGQSSPFASVGTDSNVTAGAPGGDSANADADADADAKEEEQEEVEEVQGNTISSNNDPVSTKAFGGTPPSPSASDHIASAAAAPRIPSADFDFRHDAVATGQCSPWAQGM